VVKEDNQAAEDDDEFKVRSPSLRLVLYPALNWLSFTPVPFALY
jgi:hypothetical protein